ncbi:MULTISPECIES: VOC family protein [Bacillaceae]|uniref:VOC family protein n=1 Tax=Evansella alkalicola TaxID=745819 RepID=A0ABS6JMU2_9BACI|nr:MULTISPECIES: VOC family protein [Bacillaceae]MBU9719876.1 VOC family protein [Bacillus alkalicola]
MIVTPNFHFNGECLEALRLYEKAFGGQLLMCLHYNEANPEDMSTENLSEEQKQYVYHAEMMIGSQRFMFSDSLTTVPTGQHISIVITFNKPDEVRGAYNVLKFGSTIIHPLHETTYSNLMVSLIDKFGMRWELMTERA